MVERIKFATQLSQSDWVIVEQDKLTQAFCRGTSARRLPKTLGERWPASDFDFDIAEEATEQKDETSEDITEVEDAPVVRFLQKMLVDAINMRASDSAL